MPRVYLSRRSRLAIQRYYRTFLALSTCKYLFSNLYGLIVQIQAMMDLIHTPPATGPTQSQLDDALGCAEELQGRLNQAEREHDSRVPELEARVAASDAAMARVQFKASSMRRVLLFCFNTLAVVSFSTFLC